MTNIINITDFQPQQEDPVSLIKELKENEDRIENIISIVSMKPDPNENEDENEETYPLLYLSVKRGDMHKMLGILEQAKASIITMLNH